MAANYPPAKHGGANGAPAAAPFPSNKPPQLYGSSRPIYRAPPQKRRRRRCSLCCCCCWAALLLLALLLLAAIAGGVFYVLFRPHRPTFSLSSLSLPLLNVTTNSLNSRLNVSISARNPNKKLQFVYDEISVTAYANGIDIGNGIFPPFVHVAGNATLLKTALGSEGGSLEASAASDLKKKSNLEVVIRLETKAAVRLGGLKTRRVQIRVSCPGVSVAVPKSKVSPPVYSPDDLCGVELRVKIFSWYL